MFVGQFVLVRTYSAGVHMGTLREMNGTALVLSDARRLWRWQGAFSLSEVARHGVAESSRISEVVPEILLTEAIEVIPCSPESKENLCRARNN